MLSCRPLDPTVFLNDRRRSSPRFMKTAIDSYCYQVLR